MRRASAPSIAGEKKAKKKEANKKEKSPKHSQNSEINPKPKPSKPGRAVGRTTPQDFACGAGPRGDGRDPGEAWRPQEPSIPTQNKRVKAAGMRDPHLGSRPSVPFPEDCLHGTAAGTYQEVDGLDDVQEHLILPVLDALRPPGHGVSDGGWGPWGPCFQLVAFLCDVPAGHHSH